MRTLFMLVIVFCSHCIAQAQPYYFNKNYEYNGLPGYTGSVVETDSGYIFIGVSFDLSFSESGTHFFKINNAGDTIFSKKYFKPLYFFGTGVSGSVFSVDSFYYFSGSEALSGNLDIVFYKFNSLGDTIWSRVYGWVNGENGNRCFQTSDGGFAITGWTQSFGNGSSDFILIKTDANGNQQWMNTYGTNAVEDGVSGQQTLDGGFILSGRKNNQFYIVKTDAAGNQQWDISYANTIGVCFAQQLTDSGYILSGSQDISGDLQGCLIRTDKVGNLIWQNNFGLPVEDSWLYSIPIVLSDGSFVCSGTYKPGNGPSKGWLLKTDGLGNQMWSRIYDKNPTGNNQFYDVKLCSDNGFIMSGYTMMASQDPWLVKVDSNGCLIANCNVGVSEMDESTWFSVYPNPTKDELFLLNLPTNENTEILIYNVMGELIRHEHPDFSGQQPAIHIGDLLPGIILVCAKVNGKRYYCRVLKL